MNEEKGEKEKDEAKDEQKEQEKIWARARTDDKMRPKQIDT